MARASRLLSGPGKQRLEEAIAAAEKSTSGELVVCIASRSGRYDRGEDVVGVCVALAAVAAVWLVAQGVTTDGWGTSITLGLLPVLGVFVVGFSFGAALATWLPPLGLLFTTRSQIREAVRDRASVAFQRFGVRGTRAASGILIYVSVLERMVWVLGDDAVSNSIEQHEWDAVRDAAVDGLRRNAPDEGLLKAVELAGRLLAAKLPGAHDDVDELANGIRFLD